MTIKYGFELEGFLRDGNTDQNDIVVMDKDKPLPRDDFPGLVEVRTVGGATLASALGALYSKIIELEIPKGFWVDFETPNHEFKPAQLSYMRKNFNMAKEQMDVVNLYGREPRLLRGKTLASLQINMSETRTEERVTWVGKRNQHKVTYPASSGLLDIGSIVRRLDKEFATEIRDSKRQPGFYAIKDGGTRLEYRSLPNSVWNGQQMGALYHRIKKAVEG